MIARSRARPPSREGGDERHNAMNAAMIGELAKAAQQVMANDDALAIGWQKGAV